MHPSFAMQKDTTHKYEYTETRRSAILRESLNKFDSYSSQRPDLKLTLRGLNTDTKNLSSSILTNPESELTKSILPPIVANERIFLEKDVKSFASRHSGNVHTSPTLY